MKFVDVIRRSGRNLRQAKMRTFLTASAIAVGGFTLTITLAAATGARGFSDKLIKANFDPKAVFAVKDKNFFNGASSKPQLYSTDLGTTNGATLKQFTPNDIAKIKKLPHVTSVVPSYNITAQFITREGAKQYTGAVNVYDPSNRPQTSAGHLPAQLADNQVLLPDDYLPLLRFKNAQDAIGKMITVQVRQFTGQTTAKQYTIAAVTTKSTLNISFDPVGPYVSSVEAGTLNSFINGGTVIADLVPSVTLRGDKSVDADQLKKEVEGAGYQARTAKDLEGFLNQIITVLQSIIIVFGLITLVASFFGVVNTQYISVLERTREIGLMKALGTSRRTISRLFMVEATWIGFLGAALGAVIGIVAGTALNPWISDKLNFGSDRLLVFKPAQVVALIVFLMLITTIAGWLPARKAAKLDPIEALRTE
jgi:putative ABC transport system permease protein